ncbi:hypothetical protein DES52_109129 [Deinococcus yavapaiensis KR-236]|uniref:Uncharacterized protein n=1 Tax=Deinococcus yavapaiensis KR-236 TaxID=694435 RepID=A0A318S491_9DEIO|nr:hypothetical protein DES52_109129 [Deinococcus yavapaiensis KR-236]
MNVLYSAMILLLGLHRFFESIDLVLVQISNLFIKNLSVGQMHLMSRLIREPAH